MDLEEIIFISKCVIFTVVAVCILSMSIVAAGNFISFPAEIAKIESLRLSASEMQQWGDHVQGQVAAANSKIAENQRYNQMPIICLVIPNGWEEVEPIEIR